MDYKMGLRYAVVHGAAWHVLDPPRPDPNGLPVDGHQRVRQGGHRKDRGLDPVHGPRAKHIVELTAHNAARQASNAVVGKAEEGLPAGLKARGTVLLGDCGPSRPRARKGEAVQELQWQDEPRIHKEGHQDGPDDKGCHGRQHERGRPISSDDGSARVEDGQL